jgi:AraC-like DNA-binding protein
MLVLPIPLITSLALGFLLLRAILAGRRFWPIPALLAACAAQGVVIALAQYYAVPAMRLVQPVTATVIPPLAWLAFRTTALRPFDPPRDWLHLGIPAFTAFCVVFAPQTLDGVVSGIFIVYGLVMLHALGAGADGLPLMRLEAGDWPPRIWRIMAVLLILSALGDGVIAAAQMLGMAWLQPWIVSTVSSLSLLLIGGLSLSNSLEEGEETLAPAERAPLPEEAGRDTGIMIRLDAVLADHALFLDPGLTLSRLARRLGLPAKQLSAAINRATGQNVSRTVNAYRIRHACDRLRDGCSVTGAMLESGFNTKSNFNREFQRVTGRTPTAWLAEAVASSADPLPPAAPKERDHPAPSAHRLAHPR